MRNFVAFAFLVILVYSSFNAEAEKDPVWTWSSSSSITNVGISSDSMNISATYAQSVSLWKNDTSFPHKPNTTKTYDERKR